MEKYIYIVKCKEGFLDVDNLILTIKKHYEIEKNIVEFHNKSQTLLNLKWQPLTPLLNVRDN